ncbi:alpha/beta hydrolase [Corynebacterium pseudokroppenstedtii]|uniref:Alpha/beta hydrolase n=1 Tax=Corynebacterium pseudokroppenstedtii TaxID=2804917 RepID=A0AAU0Q123_9CORY|nr:alpha/beta hydrolase [Corynebacterium pseudokroppenstedtii]QRP14902.1 alpha/beta hydrolase [Corynebacterium kroppenstedtii]MBY0790732.1 alpha/beta hydrolase [Corynebacterium pseudokroppenstedtii]MCF6792545.1 alpha/beta hydrolase [Corynebacterium pseudokroppenstedtii]MCF8702484.1 alpha/beta hydrolase [Corynebacterium pseudokroppenstedtii]MCG2636002.1 alpha/beta hydrolase [Corynebacterium pseudokroppenstedtii]
MATANQGQRSSRDVSKPGQQLTFDFGKDFDRDVEFYRRADDAPVFLSTAVDSYSDRDAPIRRRLMLAWLWLRPDPVGVVLGTVAFLMAMTPSLLPRTWLFQGVVCGVSAVTAYALGVVIHWIWDLWLDDLIAPRVEDLSLRLPRWRWGSDRRLETAMRRLEAEARKPTFMGGSLRFRWRFALDVALFIAVPVATIIMSLFAVRWQNQIARTMGAEAYTPAKFLLVIPVGLGLWAAVVGVVRVLINLVEWLADHGPQRWGDATRTIAAWLVVVVVLVFVGDKIVPGTTMSVAERVFSVRNNKIRSDLVQPTVPERSGSPQSEASWDGLGAFGTRFTGLGLHKDELEELTGQPAKEPIRVYGGLKNEPDDQARANLVVRELERTHAANREVLFVIPTTGTGWVNPTAAQAIELMFNGNTAIAADQYSFLPSGLQFVADRERVKEAGKVLINTVVDWWNTLPKDHRPRIYVYGESLGTSAGEGAFSGLRDIVNSVNGVLWVGPQNSNNLWSQFVARRDLGTPEVEPTYSDGLTVRFANGPKKIWSWEESHEPATREDSPLWPGPRVLYLQHPSDPVVWWSPKLLFQRPDWLKEPPKGDRSPAMTWVPILTFWQVTLDLPVAANVPNGHGHNYGFQLLDGLAAVAGNGKFTQDDMPRLKKQLATAMEGQGPEKEVGVDQKKMNGN